MAWQDLKKEHSLLSDYAANSCVKWAKDPDNAQFIRKGIIYTPTKSTKSVSEIDSSDSSDSEQGIVLCVVPSCMRVSDTHTRLVCSQ